MKKKVDLVGSIQEVLWNYLGEEQQRRVAMVLSVRVSHQSCVAIGHTAAEMLPYCRKWEVKEVKDVCFG